MKTKKELMALLENNHITYEHQPVIERLNWAHMTGISLNPGNVFMGKPVLHCVNRNIEGAARRFAFQWQKYNRWLDRWYARNSPGPHLSSKNELITQLRATGWPEDRVQAQIERIKGTE
jgi:hypothetical protein